MEAINIKTKILIVLKLLEWTYKNLNTILDDELLFFFFVLFNSSLFITSYSLSSRKFGRKNITFIEKFFFFVQSPHFLRINFVMVYFVIASLGATCLFTRLESLAWSQQGFWQLSYRRNCIFMKLCCGGGTSNFSTFSLSSKQARRSSPTLIPPWKKGIINLKILQELSCQKPWWTRLNTQAW